MAHADYAKFTESSKKQVLETVLASYDALAADNDNWVANLANAASLLWHAYHSLDRKGRAVNWAGFYVVDKKNPQQLILGPFQGAVACQTIKIGKGVCGTAAASKKTQLVTDVEKFPGHIACDSATKSEIVVPVITQDGEVRGVIDLDCGEFEGFDEEDQKALELLAEKIASTCEW